MIIYHGSTVPVEKPEIRQSEAFLDFGTGFYMTTSYEQAERWTRIKMRRMNAEIGYVSVYELYRRRTLLSVLFGISYFNIPCQLG